MPERMGSHNVQLCYGRWGHLPDRPFRLLAFMALISMDEDDPPLFWQGREAMCIALGRMLPTAPAPTDTSPRAEQFRKQRRADFEAVKNAMRALFTVGVVEVHKECGPGQPTVYRLMLHAATGKAEPVERGRLSLPPTSKEPQEPQENTTSTQVGTSPAAVENNAAEDDEFGYAQAVEILQSLPDLGGEYMARVTDDRPLQERIISAARLCLSERNVS